MNWTNINSAPEESKAHVFQNISNSEINENELIQLKKFQDPANNLVRQECITLLTRFGELLEANNITEMIDSVLTNDCEFFILSSTRRTPLQYCLNPRDLPNLYEGIHIQERRVRESYVDLEKGTACQLCNFKIQYEDEDSPIDEIAAEIFTIKNNKISKYRAFFSKMTPAYGNSDPFAISDRNRILAMVKQINYALADQPDFGRVADMLHDHAQYKIWSWDSKKCFIGDKQNLVETFEAMQENILIKRIVPYEVYTQTQTAVASYVYHLEDKTGNHTKKKYIWLNTCYYQFDNDCKLIKVSQQGELYLEGDIEIPFTVHSRENLLKKIQKVYTEGVTSELFYRDVFAINMVSHVFGLESSQMRSYQGTSVFDRVAEHTRRNKNALDPNPNISQRIKLVESIFDSCDFGYDVFILVHRICKEQEHNELKNEDATKSETIVVTRYKLEYGKIVNACGFITHGIGSIPSSFEEF